MNRDFLEATLLKFSLPYELVTVTDEAISAWAELFSDEKELVFHEAVRLAVLESDKFPTPAMVKKKLSLLKTASDASLEDIYAEIFQAVGTCGVYQEARAMAQLSVASQRICKAIGWQVICMTPSDQVSVLRAQIRGLFEGITQGEKRKAEVQESNALIASMARAIPIKTIDGGAL